jgi:hypothetical protein
MSMTPSPQHKRSPSCAKRTMSKAGGDSQRKSRNSSPNRSVSATRNSTVKGLGKSNMRSPSPVSKGPYRLETMPKSLLY